MPQRPYNIVLAPLPVSYVSFQLPLFIISCELDTFSWGIGEVLRSLEIINGETYLISMPVIMFKLDSYWTQQHIHWELILLWMFCSMYMNSLIWVVENECFDKDEVSLIYPNKVQNMWVLDIFLQAPLTKWNTLSSNQAQHKPEPSPHRKGVISPHVKLMNWRMWNLIPHMVGASVSIENMQYVLWQIDMLCICPPIT